MKHVIIINMRVIEILPLPTPKLLTKYRSENDRGQYCSDQRQELKLKLSNNKQEYFYAKTPAGVFRVISYFLF